MRSHIRATVKVRVGNWIAGWERSESPAWSSNGRGL